MTDLTAYTLLPIAVVTCALAQMVKGTLPEGTERYLPLAAGLIGLACAVALRASGALDGNLVEVVATGLVSGLAGTGVFEAVKGVTKRLDGGE